MSIWLPIVLLVGSIATILLLAIIFNEHGIERHSPYDPSSEEVTEEEEEDKE